MGQCQTFRAQRERKSFTEPDHGIVESRSTISRPTWKRQCGVFVSILLSTGLSTGPLFLTFYASYYQ